MSYQALSFVYDDIPSEKFGLFICSTSSSSSDTFDGGGNVKLVTDKTPSMDVNYLLDIEYDDVFEFPLMFGSMNEVNRHTISLINSWLIGQPNYKKLRIIQDDMSTMYYNCIMTDFKITSFGNLPYVFECKVICDRPYGLGNTQTHKIPLADDVLKTITIRNNSHTSNLTYPIMKFTTTKANSNMSIINVTNNNYETKFENLSASETITLDCGLQIIKSSLDVYRLEKFNKHWFELVPKLNQLRIKGNSTLLEIEYKPIRKMG